MNTVEFFETGEKVSVPGSWSEVTPGQVRWIFREYDRCLKRGFSPLAFNVSVLYHLMGVRRTLKGALCDALTQGRPSRRDENVYLLCEKLLSFLFSEDAENEGAVMLSFDSVVNPLPVVRSGLFRLHGPSDLLQDLTFGEFRHASAAVKKFFRSKDVADLDEMIAFLYRPRSRKSNKAGRMVRDVDNRSAGRFVRMAAGLSGWRKNLIMMWFSACLKYIQSGTLEINGEEVELGLLFSGEDESSGVRFGWNDLLVEVAKENSIGNIDDVDGEPLFSVLSIMWHNYKERKRYDKIVKASKGH